MDSYFSEQGSMTFNRVTNFPTFKKSLPTFRSVVAEIVSINVTVFPACHPFPDREIDRSTTACTARSVLKYHC